MTKAKIAVVIPAAGVGSRMKSATPKQYISLHNKVILQHTLEKLSQLKEISTFVVAVSHNDPYFNKLDFPVEVVRVDGGAERANSVLNGVNYLQQHKLCDWVLVHDAARPLVCVKDIERLIDTALSNNAGAILAAKVRDTIKQGDASITRTVPREQLWQAFTPQIFPLHQLQSALTCGLESGLSITDEASAVEAQGEKVLLVAGRNDNIKITTPEDLLLATVLLSPEKGSSDND